MLYLTARAVGQMKITRNYLEGIEQDGLHMPKGPIICSPNRTFASLIREVVRRKPQVISFFLSFCLEELVMCRNLKFPCFDQLVIRLSVKQILSWEALAIDLQIHRVILYDWLLRCMISCRVLALINTKSSSLTRKALSSTLQRREKKRAVRKIL